MLRSVLSLLFPSWSFFDRAGLSLKLEGWDKENSDWINVYKCPSRSIFPLLGNWEWNRYLYFQTRLEHLYEIVKGRDLMQTKRCWGYFISDFQLDENIQYRLLDGGEELVIFGRSDD